MWPHKTVLYWRKVVLQQLFLRTREKIGGPSAWTKVLKSTIKSSGSCCSSKVFILTWKVLSAMHLLCGRPLLILKPLLTGPFHEDPEDIKKNPNCYQAMTVRLAHKTDGATYRKLCWNSLTKSCTVDFISSDKANKVTQVTSIFLEWNVAIFGCRTSCTYMQPNTTLHIHLMQMSFEHFILLSAPFDGHVGDYCTAWWLPL